MIVKIIMDFLLGFVNISVEGFFVERFVNSCKQQKIMLWRVKRKTATLLTANMNIKNFKKIRDIARKTKCKVIICSKRGLPILLYRYRKRKLLVLLTIPILFAIILSSQFVWNIEVTGLTTIPQEKILEALNEEGLSIGKRKSSIDSKKIINSIRLKREDISWMAIDMKGTNIIVNIVEAEKKPNIIDKNVYCNIIASKEGMISKITADMGTAVVKKGDIVKKGDVLIAGVMEGKYTERRNVHAKGEVRAKVWYTKKKESGLTREITEETGNRKNRYAISLYKFKINLYKTLPNFEICDTINTANQMKLFQNFYLPISIEKTTYIEKKNTRITYGKEELQTILIQELEKEFETDGSKEWNITNKFVHFYEKEGNKLEVEMTYEVIEDIAMEAKL